MINVIMYRKAKLQLDNQINFLGLGNLIRKDQGAFVYPDLIIEEYENRVKILNPTRLPG